VGCDVCVRGVRGEKWDEDACRIIDKNGMKTSMKTNENEYENEYENEHENE
jgi:hypothetical protein